MAPSRHPSPRPLGLPALMLMLAGLTVSTLTAGTSGSSHDATTIRFDSETVRLYVLGDSLEVWGLYRFDCGAAIGSPVDLAYPYPVDSLLGGVRPVSLDYRVAGGDWRPLERSDVLRKMVSFWSLPPCGGRGLEVRAIYRQELLTSYARYIVTTTPGWGRPLRSAVFEIHLPEGAEPGEFSYPFERVSPDDELFYKYEATDFMPDRDITVTWKEE
jgi:hypothetical protein